jgi:hypothetical protein
MNTQLLSILGLAALLILLIAVGLVAQSYKEHFANHVVVTSAAAAASPVMANLVNAATRPTKELPQISTMDRDADVIHATEQQVEGRGKCPVCKEQCPDMSKYIRRDSIPCWNCSL